MPSWLLTQVSTRAHRLVAERLAQAGARGYHYRLLAALEESGPASQAVLGRRTGIDRSDVVAALNELAEGGMLERSPDTADRRRNVVTLTPAGAAHLGKLDAVLAGVQDELLAPLSRSDRQLLVGMLHRVVTSHAAR